MNFKMNIKLNFWIYDWQITNASKSQLTGFWHYELQIALFSDLLNQSNYIFPNNLSLIFQFTVYSISLVIKKLFKTDPILQIGKLVLPLHIFFSQDDNDVKAPCYLNVYTFVQIIIFILSVFTLYVFVYEVDICSVSDGRLFLNTGETS